VRPRNEAVAKLVVEHIAKTACSIKYASDAKAYVACLKRMIEYGFDPNLPVMQTFEELGKQTPIEWIDIFFCGIPFSKEFEEHFLIKLYDNRAQAKLTSLYSDTWDNYCIKIRGFAPANGNLFDSFFRSLMDKSTALETKDIYFLNCIIGVVQLPTGLGDILADWLVNQHGNRNMIETWAALNVLWKTHRKYFRTFARIHRQPCWNSIAPAMA
jgi:hypothetical protein